MRIEVKWLGKLTISKGSRGFFDSIKHFNFEQIPAAAAGIYVFARQHGNMIEPIYVGKAGNLRSRIKTQFNNLNLMTAVNNSKSGSRILLVGTIAALPNQTLGKILPIAERAHIRAALAAGYALVNKQGTKTKTHTIEIVGSKPHAFPFEREILANQ